MDDLDFMGEGFLSDPMFPSESKPESVLNESEKKVFGDFFNGDSTFKQIKNENNDRKSISKQIKNLSPEMKALLLDNVLKKRDDV